MDTSSKRSMTDRRLDSCLLTSVNCSLVLHCPPPVNVNDIILWYAPSRNDIVESGLAGVVLMVGRRTHDQTIVVSTLSQVAIKWLLHGWTTVRSRQVNCLGIQPTTLVNSAFHPSGVGKLSTDLLSANSSWRQIFSTHAFNAQFFFKQSLNF